MIIRKLRLQRGWSQEQLAEMASVSTRTIQRIERGKQPSVETAKALAAIFEVNFQSILQGNTEMNTETSTTEDATIAPDEQQSMQYVKGLKEFYSHAGMYLIFVVALLIFQSPLEPKILLGFAGWGIGVVLHGLVAYEVINVFNASWEKRMVEKHLGRKL